MNYKFMIPMIIFGLSYAQEDQYVLKKTFQKITIDGNVTETEWGKFKAIPMGVSYPVYGSKPSQKTTFYLTYDDDYLYAGIINYDTEPDKVRSNTLNRDEWSSDDAIGLVLDTFNDNENASVFIVNPEGVRVDWSVFNDANSFGGEPFNSSWNTYWDAKTTKHADGWSAEFRIPFSSLKFSVQNDQVTMGLLTFRYLPRFNEMQNYPMIPPKFDWGFLKPSLAKDIVFKNIKSKNPIYITPYVLTGNKDQYNTIEDDDENILAYEHEAEIPKELGLDIKLNLTNNLTADITINTDFAQVEADNQQVNLSQFSLFFPEKRLFFQERSSLFSFSTGGPTSVFYSRQIGISDDGPVRIIGGARVVGHVGQWDIGLINMHTEKSAELPSENFGIFRAKRQIINPYSNAGVIFTSRIGDDGHYNYVYGLDTSIRFGETDHYFTFKWVQSFDNDEEYKGRTRLVDNSRVTTSIESRNNEGLSYDVSFMRSGEFYNPGIGFVSRENFYGFFESLAYGTVYNDDSWIQNRRFYFRSFTGFSNDTREIETASINMGVRYETKNGANFDTQLEIKQENITEEFELPNDVLVDIGYYKFSSLNLSYSSPFGDQFRYDTNARIGTFYNGDIYTFSLGPKWAVNKNLNLGLDYEYNNGQFDKTNDAFTVNIYRLKSRYAFNMNWVLSSFIQYNSDSQKSNINARLRYNPFEGTDVYLVYDQTNNYHVGREIPILPKYDNKTLILKFNYTVGI